MGRNILINSQPKNPFYEQWQEEIKQNWERHKKHRKNDTDESDFSENEIPDVNSLKPYQFKSKANRDTYCINSSSSDEEEGAE